MIDHAIYRAFLKAVSKKWDKIYVGVDIHETVLIPNWELNELPTEFYPESKEVLQMMSKRKDLDLILWTCSWPEEIEKYEKLFKESDIHFKGANRNDEVKTKQGGYGYYETKPYFDLVLDDKSGFFPRTDWKKLKAFLTNTPELPFLISGEYYDFVDVLKKHIKFDHDIDTEDYKRGNIDKDAITPKDDAFNLERSFKETAIIRDWPTVKGNEGHYEHLDMENFEIVDIDKNREILRVQAGGDWQKPHYVDLKVDINGKDFRAVDWGPTKWKDGITYDDWRRVVENI